MQPEFISPIKKQDFGAAFHPPISLLGSSDRVEEIRLGLKLVKPVHDLLPPAASRREFCPDCCAPALPGDPGDAFHIQCPNSKRERGRDLCLYLNSLTIKH